MDVYESLLKYLETYYKKVSESADVVFYLINFLNKFYLQVLNVYTKKEINLKNISNIILTFKNQHRMLLKKKQTRKIDLMTEKELANIFIKLRINLHKYILKIQN